MSLITTPTAAFANRPHAQPKKGQIFTPHGLSNERIV